MSVYSFDIERFYTKPVSPVGYNKSFLKSSFKWRSLSEYNKDGYLTKEVNFFRGEKRSDLRYTYILNDTVLEVIEHNLVNINHKKQPTSTKYTYDEYGYCKRVDEKCGDGDYVCINNNFVWDKGKLISMDYIFTPSTYSRFVYSYNKEGRKVEKKEYLYTIDSENPHKIEDCEYVALYRYEYDEQGRLSQESKEYIDHSAVMTDVCPWSKNALYKYVIKYVYHGKSNLYTKSYFLTERGKKFYERIKYK